MFHLISAGRTEPEEEAPKFTENLSPVTTNEGQGIKLTCTVTGNPEPNIEWFQNGQVGPRFMQLLSRM